MSRRLSLVDDLNGKFLTIIDAHRHRPGPEKDGAHGVMFLCPKCYANNGGPVGTHSVICWSRSAGTPEDREPLPGRWKMNGTSLDDLTLDGDAVGGGGARSILLVGGCGWHGFVDAGFAHGDIPNDPASVSPEPQTTT